MSLSQLASSLVAAERRTAAFSNPRAHDSIKASAELRGMFRAVAALNLAMTPAHAEHQLYRARMITAEQRGMRPVTSPREWDAAVAAELLSVWESDR